MSDTYHVIPVNDLIEHDTDGDTDCICGPETRPVERDDGSMGWVIKHHSLDGREAEDDAELVAEQEENGAGDDQRGAEFHPTEDDDQEADTGDGEPD